MNDDGGTATNAPPRLYAADLTGCAALGALAAEEVAARFALALERAGATVVHRAFHVYPGGGVTCALVLSESHAVLHTWPESGTVNVDIFSCSARLRVPDAIEDLRRALGARCVSLQEIPRADGRRRETGPRR